MNKLTKSKNFGKNKYTSWQIIPKELSQIKAKIELLYEENNNFPDEETIETVCIALYELGYLEFKK